MNLREQFEKLHPVADGAKWSDHYGCYIHEHIAPIPSWVRKYNVTFRGFQSGHAAGLEDAAKYLEGEGEHFGEWFAAAIRAMKEPK